MAKKLEITLKELHAQILAGDFRRGRTSSPVYRWLVKLRLLAKDKNLSNEAINELYYQKLINLPVIKAKMLFQTFYTATLSLKEPVNLDGLSMQKISGMLKNFETHEQEILVTQADFTRALGINADTYRKYQGVLKRFQLTFQRVRDGELNDQDSTLIGSKRKPPQQKTSHRKRAKVAEPEQTALAVTRPSEQYYSVENSLTQPMDRQKQTIDAETNLNFSESGLSLFGADPGRFEPLSPIRQLLEEIELERNRPPDPPADSPFAAILSEVSHMGV